MSLQEDIEWFESFKHTPEYEMLRQRPVAYFCAEFALSANIPTYSGGLGILAGDVIREASDRGLPMVGMGLYYNKGYICKMREDGENFIQVCQDMPPQSVGLEPVVDKDGQRVLIHVPIQDRQVAAQAWVYHVGSVPVYFLDTNVLENDEHDRTITDRLYVDNKEIRLKQEIMLGIGGLRFLEAIGVHPAIWHLNEGHSALLTLELVHHQMRERGIGFDEAKQFARRRVVFTNHTLVLAGNEIYNNDLVGLMLSSYSEELGVPVDQLVALGLVHESSTFSMTMLSLRMSSIVNGVSKLHATKAKQVWGSHPMVGITNGVHIPTWDRLPDLSGALGAMRSAHQEQKKKLLAMIAKDHGHVWSEDDLLLGWARRITRYKRPLAILEDTQRFVDIARRAGRPVRLVMAGQPHPSDTDGLTLLTEMRQAVDGELGDIATYTPNYNMESAQTLVAGCDVWLNTPVVGFEASGTSGMKAALNGVLPCSTKDGWVAEAELFGVGWIVNSDQIGQDLLGVLERDIVPMYYDQPELWERHMRNARDMVLNRFNTTRMLREYVQVLYS